MRLVLLALLAATLLASGCTTTRGPYDWGAYDELLYVAYKDPTKTDELRQRLETHITALEAANSKVAPGLYAELGTLYLEGGDDDTAIYWYEKERAAWPESRGFMTALIVNLQRRKGEAAKAAGEEEPQ